MTMHTVMALCPIRRLKPKLSGTFGFNFEYKGFSVNTSFYYKLGGQYYNQTLVDKVENVDIQ